MPTAGTLEQAVTARATKKNNQSVVTATAKAVRAAALTVMQPVATSTATASIKKATINHQQQNSTLVSIASGVT